MPYNQRTLKQGRYIPKFKEKYKGNALKVIFRSGLELKWYRFFDNNPFVLEWNSEEIFVPYTSDLDGKRHRYYVDVWARIKTKSEEIKEYLIEIKPWAFTIEPPPVQKKTRASQQKIMEWVKNMNKWKAAQEYAKDKGMTFTILTEKDFNR
jgi:hypothetical protein